MDSEFRLAAVNSTARTSFDDIPDLIGRDFDEVMHLLRPKARADDVVGLFRRTLETGRPYVAPEEQRVRPDDGETEFYQWRISRIPLAEGRNGVVCYFLDITEQVQARQDAETARAEAERANLAKSQFLAAMSHELRTPLNAIQGHVQLLEMGLRGPVTAEQTETLERVQRSQRVLQSLINDVLNFARLEAGRVDYEIQSVDVARGGDVVQMIEPQLMAKGLAFENRSPAPRVGRLGQGAADLRSTCCRTRSSSPMREDASLSTRRRARVGRRRVYLRVSDTGAASRATSRRRSSIRSCSSSAASRPSRTASGSGSRSAATWRAA